MPQMDASKPLRQALLIQESCRESALVARWLQGGGNEITRVRDVETARSLLTGHYFDLIVLDPFNQRFGRFVCIKYLAEGSGRTPIVVLLEHESVVVTEIAKILGARGTLLKRQVVAAASEMTPETPAHEHRENQPGLYGCDWFSV